MNSRAGLRSVAVIGGGPVALVYAVALKQALPAADVAVVPAAVPEDALADRFPLALPSVHAVLARIGMPVELLLARGVARPRLASRFDDWSRDGAPWMVGDDAVATLAEGRLPALWLRARDGRERVPPFHALDPACVAAVAGIVDPRVEPALHLDPARLNQALASIARQGGVRFAADGIADADLTIDASGRRDGDWEDWQGALPCGRVAFAPAAGEALYDAYRATAQGWTAHWPGVTVTAGGREGVAITPGRRATPFHGRVLAIGDAAVQPGPLGRAGFTLALGQLALLLELLPAQGSEPLLQAELNRRMALQADRMRDFLSLHYHGGGRTQGPFWHGLRNLPRPASLDGLLARFARRGQVVPADEELVHRDAWSAVLLGQGMRPERPDPVALSIPPDRAARLLTDLATRIAALDYPA
ncbi:tryptophan 7-halogenase [Sphingomonas sp. 2R-10]|uniref:tryptophan 7-halogenase n=1 Tax=Sphingomonas sp. 2R-10 TaxID=3045148 RepID=UPI000F76B08F|nr:tryptophan 7-halogenase [Sphingomonas sp. 2R-10]MDJ0276981.1 tryptophan 7-halogenase [Sphingomonas sp. 2R-10]